MLKERHKHFLFAAQLRSMNIPLRHFDEGRISYNQSQR